MMKTPFALIVISSLLLLSCADNSSDHPDLIIHNASVYTASEQTAEITAIAIKEGKIQALGDDETILKSKGATTTVKDAKGQFLMPGFIEGHGHFYNFGKSLQNLNFLKDTSWAEIVKKVEEKVKTTEKGEWIYGRGWHQEKWRTQPEDAIGAYPTHSSLSEISPDNPVILSHASGHSVFANSKAMEQAGINKETPDPKGGHIIKGSDGNPAGVFEENAMDPIIKVYNEAINNQSKEDYLKEWDSAIALAQKECLQYGITSFQDAGATYEDIKRYKKMAQDGGFDIRLWSMIRHSSEELESMLPDAKGHRLGNNFFTCNAIKSEVDGALGAHGAWLLEPYADKPDFYGQNTTDIEEVAKIAKIADANGMQLCVHAIGDRANKEVLDIIESYNTPENDLRWRVEHAQHLNPSDIMRFKNTGAIASMQGIHCTSDAPFVVRRLGQLRAKVGAYAWKALLNQEVTIVNGTDVPVESINPFENFYASVTRTRTDNGMTFFIENRMSREQALRSYTIDAAYGAFEEDIKGSLEVGKLADVILLDKNLLECEDEEILEIKVLMTVVGGEVKYGE